MARFIRRRRPRRGMPVQRQLRTWRTVGFNESAIDTTAGASTELVLFDPSANISQISSNEVLRIRRVIFDGYICWTPQSTTLAFEQGGFVFAVYSVDADDTDSDLLGTTQGTILQGGASDRGRIYHVGTVGGTLIEIPAAVISQPFIPSMPIHIDITPQCLLGFEQLLILGVQAKGALGSVVAVASISGIARCLWHRR